MTGCWRWLLVVCLLGLGCASAKTGEDLKSTAISLNDQGYQYYRQSRLNPAERKFSQALKYNRLIDRREGIAANLNNLGVIALEQGNADQATAYFQEALTINRDREDPAALSETLNNLGLVYLAQGKVNEAQKVYQELGADTGGLDFLPFTDLEQSVRDDVAALRASPLIPHNTPISGAIYDVRTGEVNLVVRA